MESNRIDIKKAKIDKEYHLSVDYSEQTSEGVINHNVNGAAAVHDDLRLAMKELVPHIANLCEQYNNEGEPDIENIVCRGITITDGKNAGYILTGVRELSTGKKITLNTPLLSADTDEEVYEQIDNLRDQVISVGAEVRKYLFEGKKAADVQGDMFSEGEEN